MNTIGLVDVIDSIDLRADDPIEALQRAVAARATILISGGASSGKTTLFHALLREIPEGERVFAVVDTSDVERAASRSTRLVVGELHGRAAAGFVRALGGGHAGSIAAIRADSPRAALEQLASIARETGIGLCLADALAYAASVIDLVVQLDRRGGSRRIAQIATARDLVG